ncbi:hypothetical protein [Streptomyces sp. NPDC029674]|uniref:hypothetical protein n=1 Tax=Streptomyces sp. NPDC029674 TaxID=3365297 RepID=UPI003850A658
MTTVIAPGSTFSPVELADAGPVHIEYTDTFTEDFVRVQHLAAAESAERSIAVFANPVSGRHGEALVITEDDGVSQLVHVWPDETKPHGFDRAVVWPGPGDPTDETLVDVAVGCIDTLREGERVRRVEALFRTQNGVVHRAGYLQHPDGAACWKRVNDRRGKARNLRAGRTFEGRPLFVYSAWGDDEADGFGSTYLFDPLSGEDCQVLARTDAEVIGVQHDTFVGASPFKGVFKTFTGRFHDRLAPEVGKHFITHDAVGHVLKVVGSLRRPGGAGAAFIVITAGEGGKHELKAVAVDPNGAFVGMSTLTSLSVAHAVLHHDVDESWHLYVTDDHNTLWSFHQVDDGPQWVPVPEDGSTAPGAGTPLVSPPLPVHQNVLFADAVAEKNRDLRLFVVGTDHRLSVHSQDARTGVWRVRPLMLVHEPGAPGKSRVTKVRIHHVRARVVDESGLPVAGVRNLYMKSLGSDCDISHAGGHARITSTATPFVTGGDGSFTFSMDGSRLAVPTLAVRCDGMGDTAPTADSSSGPSAALIVPNRTVLDYLAGRTNTLNVTNPGGGLRPFDDAGTTLAGFPSVRPLTAEAAGEAARAIRTGAAHALPPDPTQPIRFSPGITGAPTTDTDTEAPGTAAPPPLQILMPDGRPAALGGTRFQGDFLHLATTTQAVDLRLETLRVNTGPAAGTYWLDPLSGFCDLVVDGALNLGKSIGIPGAGDTLDAYRRCRKTINLAEDKLLDDLGELLDDCGKFLIKAWEGFQHFIVATFNKLATLVSDVGEFFTMVFDIDAFKRTAEVFERKLEGLPDQLRRRIEDSDAAADQWIEHIRENTAEFFDTLRTGMTGATLRSEQQRADAQAAALPGGNQDFAHHHQVRWILDKATGDHGATPEPTPDAAASGDDASESWADAARQCTKAIGAFGDAAEHAWAGLRDTLTHPERFKDEALPELIEAARSLTDAGVSTMAAGKDAMAAMGYKLTDTLQEHLDEKMDLGLVGHILEFFGVRLPDNKTFMAWAAAIPYTVVYKLCNDGREPYPDGTDQADSPDFFSGDVDAALSHVKIASLAWRIVSSVVKLVSDVWTGFTGKTPDLLKWIGCGVGFLTVVMSVPVFATQGAQNDPVEALAIESAVNGLINFLCAYAAIQEYGPPVLRDYVYPLIKELAAIGALIYTLTRIKPEQTAISVLAALRGLLSAMELRCVKENAEVRALAYTVLSLADGIDIAMSAVLIGQERGKLQSAKAM